MALNINPPFKFNPADLNSSLDFNFEPFNADFSKAFIPGTGSRLSSSDIPLTSKQQRKAAQKIKQDEKAAFKVNNPNATPLFDKLDELSGGEFDAIGSALDIIPLAGAAITKRKSDRLFNNARLSPNEINLRTNGVQDLAGENFAQVARVPEGSSPAEREISQKFGDIAQRGQEADFERRNAESRIAQRKDITNIQNQQEQINFQDARRVEASNAQLDARRAAGFAGKQLQFETAALANANTRRAENAGINESNLVLSAAEILRSDDTVTTFEDALDKAVKKLDAKKAKKG